MSLVYILRHIGLESAMHLFGVTLLVVFQPTVVSGNGIDDEVLAVVRSQVVPALLDRTRRFGGFDVKCTFEAFQLNGSEPRQLRLKRHRRYMVAVGGKLRSLESPGDGIVAAYTTNDRYGFQVRRREDGTEYALNEIAKDHTSLGDAGGLHSLNLTDIFARMSFALGDVALADIVAENSADFDLLEARYVGDMSGRIRIAGRYRGPPDPSKWKGIYWAEFSSEAPYLVLRSGVNDPESGLGSTEMFDITYYGGTNDLAPLPRFVTRTSGSAEFGTLQTYSFEIPTVCSVDKSYFYLPHYGISEDVLRSDTPLSNRWIVVLLSLIPLLILFALIRRRPKGADWQRNL